MQLLRKRTRAREAQLKTSRRIRMRFRIVASVVLLCSVLAVGVVSLGMYREAMHIPPPVRIDVARGLGGSPRHYWIDHSQGKYRQAVQDFDGAGIPLYRLNGESYYHPVYIAQFALGAHTYYLNMNDNKARTDFLRSATWLRDNLAPRTGFQYWLYTFRNRGHEGTKSVPWVSAMAQGVGASVLVRAFVETGDTTYRDKARAALEPIFHDVAVGGVSVVRADHIFPQEFLSDSPDPPSNILNGAISALFGVHDYYRATFDPLVKEKADTIVRTFARSIDRYDTGYWSLYCEWPAHLATAHYHAVHIGQLKALYLISGEGVFLRYSEKFEEYQRHQANRFRYVVTSYAKRAMRLSAEDLPKIPGLIARLLDTAF